MTIFIICQFGRVRVKEGFYWIEFLLYNLLVMAGNMISDDCGYIIYDLSLEVEGIISG